MKMVLTRGMSNFPCNSKKMCNGEKRGGFEAASVVCIVAAGSLWGTIGLFVKKLTEAGFDSMQIGAVRVFFGAVIMAVFALIAQPKAFKISIKDVWIFIGTGFFSLTLFNFCYFTAISRSEVSVAVVLLYTSPIWVMLFSLLFFKEKITAMKLLALAMTFVGCVLVAGIFGDVKGLTVQVFFIGVAAGVCYALYSIFGRIGLKKYGSVTVTLYTFIFASAASLITAGPARTVKCIAAAPVSLVYICGAALFCTVIPYLLYTKGLEGVESSKAAIYVTTEPLVAAVIGVIVFHESIGLPKVAGIMLILSSVIVLSFEDKTTARNKAGNEGRQNRGSA